MRSTAIAVALVGTFGLAGILVPRIALSHDVDDTGDAGHGSCWGDRYGNGRWDRGGPAGPGKMGGPFGPGPIWRLDLSDPQRKQLSKLADDLRRTHWATMGRLMDARVNLRDLESAAEPDPKKVGTAYSEVAKFRQDMVEASVQARNQARTILTPGQRQQLDRWRDQYSGRGRGFQGRRPAMMDNE